MEVIAADIGGTHISVASISWDEGFPCVQRKISVDMDTTGSAGQLISKWSTAIREVTENSTQFNLGIAMPGPYDYEKGISLIESQGKMKSLFGLSVKNLLAAKLGISPEAIQFQNDAESFLKGEVLAGAGKGFDSLLGITLGTGLGSAIHIYGVTMDAKLWTAPFRKGIAEDYLGTGWFLRKIENDFGLKISGSIDLLNEKFDQEITQKVFGDFGGALGEFLLLYVVRFQTQKVILGGKVSGAMSLFCPWTHTYLESNGVQILIEKSVLGEEAALIGASSIFYNFQ